MSDKKEIKIVSLEEVDLTLEDITNGLEHSKGMNLYDEDIVEEFIIDGVVL